MHTARVADHYPVIVTAGIKMVECTVDITVRIGIIRKLPFMQQLIKYNLAVEAHAAQIVPFLFFLMETG